MQPILQNANAPPTWRKSETRNPKAERRPKREIRNQSFRDVKFQAVRTGMTPTCVPSDFRQVGFC